MKMDLLKKNPKAARFFILKPKTGPLNNFNFYLSLNPTRKVGSMKNLIPKSDERVFSHHESNYCL